MSAPTQNFVALFAGVWPRVAGLSGTPSLLVIALIANLVAVIPTAFRMHKENLACDASATACAERGPTELSSN